MDNKNYNFTIVCDTCGSSNVQITQDFKFSDIAPPELTGALNCKCHNCGAFNTIDFSKQFFKKEVSLL